MTDHNAPAIINFYDNELLTISHDNKNYVAMKSVCEGMGIDWESQRKSIERDPVLSEGTVKLTVPSKGGIQEMICLPLNYLNGWLFKVDAGRYSENDPRRAHIIRYQKECYQALYDYWHKRGSATKLCETCGKYKPITAFRKDRRRSDGYSPECSQCRALPEKPIHRQSSLPTPSGFITVTIQIPESAKLAVSAIANVFREGGDIVWHPVFPTKCSHCGHTSK
ncbi:MAG: hypothetical protein GY749_08060 [Desulfobacteraceae bacterium]|nr:hypothetical protein [Desulfobacteraceae bacterium]